MIEYIDKIVDLRRGLVDEGIVPQSLQKPLGALEKRGNPYGKMERKRADWAKDLMAANVVKILKKDVKADTLYFVDSVTSYDDRIQEIGKAAVRVLSRTGVDFGILGPAEKDSGHEVKRFGEEMLFIQLRDQNIASIHDSGVKNIVTADPHAFNALKNDYDEIPPVEHISQVMKRHIASGKIALKSVEDSSAVYTYHDPCYLGRHNGVYDASREVIDSIAGIKRVEMVKCRDRSFCCGGGGLMLFYEPIEETRMGRLRVEMAKDAGATVIVTACPFCMVNIEDAIKTTGMEKNGGDRSGGAGRSPYGRLKIDRLRITIWRRNMEILVCVKRVPDTAENEIEVNKDGSDIERDDLVYSVNEWDNYAVEEAISIRDKVGGSVTVVSVGGEEAEEIIRREMAMGADKGIHLSDQAFEESDGKGLARILQAAIAKGSYDLIMTGVQADDGAGQVGGMLAAMLDWPFASLVNHIEVINDKTIKVGREIAGGNQEMNEIDLPCVLSIQTGINEPRYVGIRGIRKVASVEIPVFGASDIGLSPDMVGKSGAKIGRVDYFVPDLGEGAEILEGGTDEIMEKLIEILKSKGGIK